MNLGFSGKMRSGKDTAALYVQRHNPESCIHGLAIALKRLCYDLEFRADGTNAVAWEFMKLCWERYGSCLQVRGEVAAQLESFTREFRGQGVDGKNRRLLQEVAEYLRAKISPDIWVDLLLDEVKRSDRPFLVPDVRKPHEVDDLRKAGFKIIRVEVSPEVQKARIVGAGELYDPVALNFYTEIALDGYDGFDAVIENNGTLAEFERKLDTVLANAYH